MIEAARRVDEQKRFVTMFKDPYQLLGVRDLPDPDEPLSEEERELFGIIDGLHTVADVVAAAPLSEYETYEALQRLMDSNWIEFVGRQDPGTTVPEHETPSEVKARNPVLRELAIVGTVIAVLIGLRVAGARVALGHRVQPREDVYAAAQVRDLRYALELYQRENGRYPARLQDLVEDSWVARDQTKLPGYFVVYRPAPAGRAYRLDLALDR
jgi:hypothetical protein